MRRSRSPGRRRADSTRRSCSSRAPTRWPTYNGDYSGRRFSTLDKINASNVDALSLAWVFRLNAGPGAGGHQGHAAAGQRRDLPHRARSRLGARRPHRPRALAPHLAIHGRHPHRQPRRGGPRRLALLRDARLPSRVAEHQGRHGALAQADLRSRPVLLRLGGAGHRRRTTSSPASAATTSTSPATSSRTIPRPARCSGAGTSCRRRRAIPAPRRWPNEEAMQARRRHDVAAGHLRSRAEPDLRHDRQSAAGHRAQQSRRRQPLHRVDRGAQSRHREDGVVLPVVAARHARLGLDPDAGAVRRRDQRPAAQAAGAGGAQRPLLRARSHHRQGARLVRVREDELVDRATTRRASRFRTRRSTRRSTARSSRPNQGGATNWPPPSFSPQTGLFYVSAAQAYSVYYIYDPSDNPQGWGGTDRGGWSESMIQAIDYKTGKVNWSHKWEANIRSGLLTTAGNLLFTGGPSARPRRAQRDDRRRALARAPGQRRSATARSPTSSTALQYILVGAGDTLWAFAMQHDDARARRRPNEIADDRTMRDSSAISDRWRIGCVDRRLGADTRAGTRPSATAAGGRDGDRRDRACGR